MNQNGTTTEPAKIRYHKCEACSQRTESKLLYRVREKNICLSCGQKELAEWNRIVKEEEQP